MQSLENEAEELAFYKHDSNRAVAVVWPAIVENRLTDALRAYMRPDESVSKELFRPEGALGTFGQKVKLGYMLGLYDRDLKEDLVLLTKIRNAFAHRVDITDFETSPIRDFMDQMTVLKVHRELLERSKKEAKPDDDFMKKTTLSILSSELCDYRNSFHLCIRFMIHKLVAIERALKNRQSPPESPAIGS
jgi:Mannitol repressor